MTADEMLAMYRDMCQVDITIRRYSGATGSRTKTDYTAKGNYRLYGGKDLIGTIAQGDQQVIVIVDDLTTAGLTLPITTADRVVIGGRERQIMAPIVERRAADSGATLIALDIQARG